MYKFHTKLTDYIFKNCRYIKTIENELGCSDFRKEYPTFYYAMLDIFKTFIISSNIIYSDSNKSYNDKIFELQLTLEDCLFGNKDNDSNIHKYSTRLISALPDKLSRIIYKKFIDWYDILSNTDTLEIVANEISQIMNELESINFDYIVKDNITYKKNKNNDCKMYLSVFSPLMSTSYDFISEYQLSFYETYGQLLNDKQIESVSSLFNLCSSACNGLALIIFNKIKKDNSTILINELTNYSLIYKNYLNNIGIGNVNNLSYTQELYHIMDMQVINTNLSKEYNLININTFDNYDYYNFLDKLPKIKDDLMSINNPFLNKIYNDLIEIHSLMLKEEYISAYEKVNLIINRNIKLFIRIS